jgi:hypothetical protein
MVHVVLMRGRWNMLKQCLDCKKEKDESEFYNRHINNGRTVYTRKKTICKLCSNERVKRWRATAQGKLARKKYNLAKAFGLTLEDWNKMLAEQNGKCAICRREFSQLKMTPFVDHDHITGRVRGLLCPVCNQFLGLIKDNPQSLLNYINPYPGWPIMWITDYMQEKIAVTALDNIRG